MNNNAVRARFRIFIIVTILLILVIIIHYGSLMIFHKKPAGRQVISKPIVERGPILDRNGRILAIQTRLYSVTAWLPSVTEPEESAELLASVIDKPKAAILEEFNNHRGFMYIKRKISPTESKTIRDMIEKGKLRGISLEPEYGRNYPEKELAAHIIGYVGTDNTGLNGIEYTYEDQLSPEPQTGENEEVYGNQIFLTIDLNIQYMTESIARKAYEEHQADTVLLLVMDAKTGDILGYASHPTFDPNVYNLYSTDSRQNRPINYAFEPGSVFKIFSLSSFMELDGIGTSDTFFCNGYYKLDSPGEEEERLQCLGVHGSVTPEDIIIYSCNAGAASASETVGNDAFYRMIKEFGFGTPSGLPLPGESYGLIRSPEDWSYRSKPTIAIGQEISVTAVQMVAAASAIANEGTMLKPHIVKKNVTPSGKIIHESTPAPVGNPISRETARAMLRMMEAATDEEGTARRTRIEGIRMAAKTGTAQMLDRKTGKYSEEAFVPSCLAIFPTNDPRFIVYTVIVYPKAGEYYGGRIAAPIVKEVAEELITYYGIPSADDTIIEHPGKISLKKTDSIQIKDTMPDLTGISKRDLLPLLKETDIDVKIYGEGWVVSQKPPPGTKITKGMTIRLELE